MDPNETLKLIDQALSEREVGEEVDALCRGLYEWVSKGGFEPDWNKYPSGYL